MTQLNPRETDILRVYIVTYYYNDIIFTVYHTNKLKLNHNEENVCGYS